MYFLSLWRTIALVTSLQHQYNLAYLFPMWHIKQRILVIYSDKILLLYFTTIVFFDNGCFKLRLRGVNQRLFSEDQVHLNSRYFLQEKKEPNKRPQRIKSNYPIKQKCHLSSTFDFVCDIGKHLFPNLSSNTGIIQ